MKANEPTALPVSLPHRRAKTLPDLHALEAFATVCEAGSMTIAAQLLGISQSAISQMVKGLELDYATALFDREVRPARPTRAGRVLHGLAQTLLTDARTVAQQMRQCARQDHALVRLGCVDSFAATVGPALIRALSGSARQLQLWSGLTPGLNAQLQSRELDLAICTEVPPGDDRIMHRLLFSETLVAVFPRHLELAPLQDLQELKRHAGHLPLIRYSRRSVIGQQIDRYLRHAGIEAARRFDFDATDPLLSLIATGMGWAISTPLCLWQSRAWLDQVQVLALPPSLLDKRDFFLLCREAEWSALADEIALLTKSVMRSHTVPALKSSLPNLPDGALSVAD